jgi:hypothetical protein
MYHAKKFSVPFAPQMAQNNEHLSNIGAFGGPSISNPANPVGNGKQRLRWTSDLLNRFVDAIAQLGGPDSGYSLFSISFWGFTRYDVLNDRYYILLVLFGISLILPATQILIDITFRWYGTLHKLEPAVWCFMLIPLCIMHISKLKLISIAIFQLFMNFSPI